MLYIIYTVVSTQSYTNFVIADFCFIKSKLFSGEVFCVLQLCLRFKENYTTDATSKNGNLFEMWDVY